MPELAPLTFHAVSLKFRFKGMDDALEAFCHGSAGLSARESQALCACVVSIFFHWDTFKKTSLERFYSSQKASARLAYACLFALRKMPPSPKKEELKAVFTPLHASAMAGEPCPLFSRGPDAPMPGTPDPDAARCNVINHWLCHADILKMVA